MQHLFFDLDGTLTDPKLGITGCVQYALEELGHIVPSRDDLEWVIGPPLQESFGALLISYDMVGEAMALYRERFAEIGYRENEVYEGVPEMLVGLREAGKTLYVASSKPQTYVEKILTHFQLDGFFARAFGSELNGARADKTDLLAHTVKDIGISVNDAVMIGDRKHDMVGARNNIMASIGVSYGYGSTEELTTAGAGHLVHDCAELHALLLKIA